MDELQGPNVQIVLGVIEGQGFNFLHSPISVTGSLNGHILESDSVGPCPTPVFATNLIWQADKKGLRLMRIGNIPMKVECFTVNHHGRRERIGYLLLNLRSMQIIPTGKQAVVHQTWHKLLGVKSDVKALHPELLLSFHVEDDITVNAAIEECAEQNLSENITKIISPSGQNQKGNWRHPTLIPRLCSEEGLIQIGPESNCSDIFLLSILIGTAVNLDMLLSETVYNKETESYCFWYSIFGHCIQTKPFRRDIHQPCVLNEKIVLRLRSSLEILKIYFTEVSLMSLKLLYGDNEIAIANMELKNLVPTEKLTEFLNRYAVNNTVTKNARCFLSLPSSGEVPTGVNGRRPYIDMEIKLKYISQVVSAKSKKEPEPTPENLNPLTARSTTDVIVGDTQREVSLRSTSLTGLEPKAVSNCYQEPTPRKLKEMGDGAPNTQSSIFKNVSPRANDQTNSASTGNLTKHSENIPKISKENKLISTSKSTETVLKQGLSLPSPIPESYREELIEAYHRYGLNVSLESVTFNIKIEGRKMQFRFHHPKAEIVSSSHPELSVAEENITFFLKDVRCRLNFISTPEEISRLLLAWPPKVSICDNTSNEIPILLGEIALDTSLLFVHNRHECSYSAQFRQPNSEQEFATVKISMFLEDCGLKVYKRVNESEQDLGPPILDERIAYKQIEELEEWKEQQKEIFRAQLAKKEEQRITKLTNEWHIRRSELEVKLSRGVEKCRGLAANLTKATDDLRLRAMRHQEAENKYKMLKENMEHTFESKQQDIKEVTRRIQDEMNHKVNMTKMENNELTEKIHALERENALLKDTIKKQDVELSDLCKTSLTKDQTAALLQELRGLEEKLEASAKSKAFFKEEWGKTVREIHRMKAERQQQVQMQIRHNKEELTSLGLKDFYNDEIQMKKDHNVLHKIRSELDCMHSGQSSTVEFAPIESEKYITSRPDLLDMDNDEKAAMLIEERDSLLRTGSYSEQDPIILTLNEELNLVMRTNGLKS